MDLTLGPHTYTLHATEHAGTATAHAVRVDTGDRFGIDVTGNSEPEALDTLTRWLEWQYEHTQALEALQQAERGYHRSLADAAFAIARDSSAVDGSKVSLEQVDAARKTLDDVRGRRPNV